jgi:hypothetical protein
MKKKYNQLGMVGLSLRICMLLSPLLHSSGSGIGNYLGFSSARASVIDNFFLDNGLTVAIVTRRKTVNGER